MALRSASFALAADLWASFFGSRAGAAFITSGSPDVGETQLPPDDATAFARASARLAFSRLETEISRVRSLSSAREVTPSVSITSSLSLILLSNSRFISSNTEPTPSAPREETLGNIVADRAHATAHERRRLKGRIRVGAQGRVSHGGGGYDAVARRERQNRVRTMHALAVVAARSALRAGRDAARASADSNRGSKEDFNGRQGRQTTTAVLSV